MSRAGSAARSPSSIPSARSPMANCRRAAPASPMRCARSGIERREARRAAAPRHGRLSGGVLGRDPRRQRRAPAQYLPHCPAIRLYPRRLARAPRWSPPRPLARTIGPLLEQAAASARPSFWSAPSRTTRPAFAGRDVHLFEDLIAGADATPFTADTLSDEVAFWLYTSGSTGDPKGVKHVHSNLMATAKLFGQRHSRHHARTTSCIPPPSCSSPTGSATP